MAKLKPAIKESWVKALRSGEYRQGQGHLYFHGRHCCLGVLAELAVKAGVTTKYESGSITEYGDHETEPGWEIVTWAFEGPLPASGHEWDVPQECHPIVVKHGVGFPMVSLITLNDDIQLPFDDIADVIDQYL